MEDQLRLSIGKVSKYLKEKYVPLYNLMFVIRGHIHISQLTFFTDPPFFLCPLVSRNAFPTIFFNANHISRHFSMRFFSSCDFCNKYHIFGKNHSSNDKVTVCRSKKRYHWSKTSMICFYHQIPRLSADTWARPPLLKP